MKTRQAALATAAVAGLAALPLSAAAASAPAAPNGSASASALMVQVSLAPLKNIVNTAGAGVLSWETVTNQLAAVQKALCGDPPTNCPLGLTLPTDLPDSLTVRIAQAEDSATLNSAATDLVAGKSDSTPIYTDWTVLNANISALQTALTNVIQGDLSQVSQALASGNVSALGSLVSLNNGTLTLSAPVLGTASFNLLGTVSAALPGKTHDEATAVQITGNSDSSVPTSAITKGLNVTVDPFKAYAVNSAGSKGLGLDTAQASASNELESVSLPDLLGSAIDTAGLKSVAAQIKSLVDQLTNLIANPSSGTSLDTSALPSPLQAPLGLIGSTLSGTVGTAAANLDLSALKTFDTQLSTLLDSVNGLVDALSQLALPDVTKLISSSQDIATAKTVPLAAGGVASSATANLGNVSILPIGGSLAGVLNTAINAANGVTNTGLKTVTDSTALLSVDGITATADAAVGPGTGSPVGTSGLHTVSVLGQTVDLDNIAKNIGLASGQEIQVPVTIPTLGTVTLDITRGVPQIVADTATYREVHMAALDVRLINGSLPCGSNCTNLLAIGGALNTSGAHTAAASDQHGISALGVDGATVAEIAAPQAIAAASMNGQTLPTGCTSNCSQVTPGTANLPKTGMLGEAGLPAGGLLIAVAISLRVIPGLRRRFAGVR